MEIIIILLLILLNGIFAMAEIAIISAKKHKLQKSAQEGNEGSRKALELADSPNRFLSTVQIGITLVGIFAGAFGGATIAKQLSSQLEAFPMLAPYHDSIALGIVVFVITYLSLVIGELVPKRLALSYPNGIAKVVAQPMDMLSQIARPFVALLSYSTDGILKLLRVKPSTEAAVSEEEVRMMIKKGTEVGIFELAEKNIVERTFRLSDRQVNSLMTPRKQIIWLEMGSSFDTIRNKVTKNTHSYYPVCKNSLDSVIGIIRTEHILTNYLIEDSINLEKTLHKPLFIPSNTPALKVLELFKKSGIHLALIVDEYGMIEGLLSLTDILEAIVGDIPNISENDEQEIIKRDSKSWLIDGLVSIEEFKDHFQIKKLPDEKSGNFDTLGGFVMNRLGRIPMTSDKIEYDNYTMEIVDMDGNRVDKILLTKKKSK